MAQTTAIAWCDGTFNPWLGCQHWSRGCDFCYADVLAQRRGWDVFGGRSKRKRTSARTWRNPVAWNMNALSKFGRPMRVFCASLADVFEDAPGPNNWRPELWRLIHDTPFLDWQILTKRPENIARMLPESWAENKFGYWPNVWLGTSIEDNQVAHRSRTLVTVPAAVHFISYEPAIGPGDEIPLEHIEWLICGGESGPGFRKMDLMWAYDMWARCYREDTTFFFKQSSGPRTEMGIDALGAVVRDWPTGWDRAELLLLS